MSQVDVVTKSTQRRGRGQGLKSRLEAFTRDFEWTWTNAVLFSLALTFFLLITTSVMPSFWMYYAESQLGWGGPTDIEGALSGTYVVFDPELGFPHLSQEMLLQIRDAIAMGLTLGPFISVLVVSAAMQNWRKRLRGGSGDSRPTGGYR
jgi:hypothetical protein